MSCKVCVTCKESKPLTDYQFAGHYNSKGEKYKRATCRSCTLKVKRKRKEQIRDWLTSYKMTLSCEGCGYSNENNKNFSPKALQFHHIFNNKSFEIGNAIGSGYSIKNIKKEIDKCVVLCSRCHAEIHDK